MQDHDFEKQVHQKMEEMKIPPSDAVWKEVERRLYPEDKKRRWIWLPFLFFALGTSGYLLYINIPASRQSLPSGTDLPLHNSNPLTANNGKIQHDEEVSKTPKYKKQDVIEIAGSSTVNKETRLSATGKKPATSGQFMLRASAMDSGSPGKTGRQERKSLLQNISANRITNGKPLENLPVEIPSSHQTQSLSSESSHYRTDDPSGNMIITKEPVPAHIDSFVASSDPFNTSLALRNLLIAANVPVRKQQKELGWEWVFSVQAGQSGVTNGKFTTLFARERVADVNNSFNSGNPSLIPSAIYIPPSDLKPGPGYSAGLSVRKQLTKRTSISAGLQYTRFSTSHKVGKQVTDSLIMLASNNSADQKSVESYFRLGSTSNYTNKYHFIELPVLLETRLTGNRFLPVYWDLGFSLSRLISSNALHFDGNARIYYTNNRLFNRNQFDFITGLPVRILQEDRFSLKAGPLFQYGLSNLINKSGGGSRHLLFIGVKADITLFK